MRTDFNKSIERGGRTTITKDVGVESESRVTKKRERKKKGQDNRGGLRRSNKWSKEFERNKGRGK